MVRGAATSFPAGERAPGQHRRAVSWAARGAHLVLAAIALIAASPVAATEFRSTAEAVTLLYDAPSTKAKPLFVLSRDAPLEVIVPVE